MFHVCQLPVKSATSERLDFARKLNALRRIFTHGVIYRIWSRFHVSGFSVVMVDCVL